jgi:hypothetical protein
VAAGDDVRVEAKALLSDGALEVNGKEAVVGAAEHADRDGGPRGEVAREANTASASGRSWAAPSSATSFGTSCRK